MENFIFLLLTMIFVVAEFHLIQKLAIIFLDLGVLNQKNPVSAVGGLPEADPLGRS
ncbi:hypothetical protein IAE35_21120 [Pseudomonas sp. S75]|uniref:hypothetical protein n=1 Tax=unclassified Pseudomonas TaxID=196821 RepID=UPI001907ED30|nr:MULTISPECIES: hypothetical protein [unclassified Pseudomonas]MBJ9978040.1 hypothetical protein [Pseudomonas sp. S30]MBK0155847.1 hypothetical protein [Pseudomonas sp. S75]